MKRLLSALLCIVMLLTVLPIRGQAFEQTDIQWLDDGSRIETVIREVPVRASNARVYSKESNCYDEDGNLDWTITLNATFTYDGVTAKAPSASVSVTIHDSDWEVVSKYASTSGAVAKADVTLSRSALGVVVEKPSYTVTLSCTPDGNIY